MARQIDLKSDSSGIQGLIELAVDRKIEQMNIDRTLNAGDLDKTGWQTLFHITAATLLVLIASGAIWAVIWLWSNLPIS